MRNHENFFCLSYHLSGLITYRCELPIKVYEHLQYVCSYNWRLIERENCVVVVISSSSLLPLLLLYGGFAKYQLNFAFLHIYVAAIHAKFIDFLSIFSESCWYNHYVCVISYRKGNIFHRLGNEVSLINLIS